MIAIKLRWVSLIHKLTANIHVEVFKTPNPNFVKFMPVGCRVLGSNGTLDISSEKYSDVSPLAQELFGVSGVTRVFYGSDYLSVAKREEVDWRDIQPQVVRIVSTYFAANKAVLSAETSLDSEQIDANDSDTVQFIKEILATRIRPNVQEDGGDVKYISFDDKTGQLRLRMIGACAGCPSSGATLKGGIEKMLTYYVKQVKSVVAQQS